MSSKQHIVVFTGAGISTAAGLKAFRGPNGLWNDKDTMRASDAATLLSEPAHVWRLWGSLRAQVDATVPTEAHHAIADAEAHLPDGFSLHVITQNVDGLHQRAGSTKVVEYHGGIFTSRCNNPACVLVPFEDHDSHQDKVPYCQLCGSLLRPDIVLFGETICPQKHALAKAQLKDAGTLIVAGTTLEVEPAAKLANVKKRFFGGRHNVLINLEPLSVGSKFFQERYFGPADQHMRRVLERLITV